MPRMYLKESEKLLCAKCGQVICGDSVHARYAFLKLTEDETKVVAVYCENCYEEEKK